MSKTEGFSREPLDQAIVGIGYEDTGERPIIVLNSEKPPSRAATLIKRIRVGAITWIPVIGQLTEIFRRSVGDNPITAAISTTIVALAAGGGIAIVDSELPAPKTPSESVYVIPADRKLPELDHVRAIPAAKKRSAPESSDEVVPQASSAPEFAVGGGAAASLERPGGIREGSRGSSLPGTSPTPWSLHPWR